MPSWRDYQEQAAAFFRTLDLEATTDESISGARGAHAVDVAVRSKRAGITQLWIVECKLWRRSVGKLHVAALGNIVQDVGADRGILLSESGFQAGAVRLAAHSNITLTSLADLRDNADQEQMMVALNWLRVRITELERARAVEDVMHQDKLALKRPIFARRTNPVILAVEGLKQAELDLWPVFCPVISEGEIGIAKTIASDLGELLPAMTALTCQLEREYGQSLAARGYVA